MQLTTIGIDLAKNVFRVHGLDRAGKAALRKEVTRRQLLRCWLISVHAWWEWRPAQVRTTGRARSRSLATKCA